MPNNDLVLVDSVIEQLSSQGGNGYNLSEQFELFCFDQVLKDYDLSMDELNMGWVDGQDDGGIDGFYTFIDGKLVVTNILSENYRKNPTIEVVVLTCKHADTFAQTPINGILSSVHELFDLSKTASELTETFNTDLLFARELFRKAYVTLASNSPVLKVRYVYASRGDHKKLARNIIARAKLLTETTEGYFQNSTVVFDFIGATELLELHRKTKTFSLRAKFIESVISRSNTSYIVLCRLDDYYRFIIDDTQSLRRYLFNSNVRDYLPGSVVNADIQSTLEAADTKENADFWLFNNGVTILASSVSVVGKEMSLENIQIVNGLQTTETIYNYFARQDSPTDDRALLLKVIVANDEGLQDRIIRATNNQNKVDLASLHATDKIQKDIEHLLRNHDWYYDRQKNYYRNRRVAQDRIISPIYMAQSMLALCWRMLPESSKLNPAYLLSKEKYAKVFETNLDIHIYLAVIEIRKGVERLLKSVEAHPTQFFAGRKRGLDIVVSYICTARRVGKTAYAPQDVLAVSQHSITKGEIKDAFNIIVSAGNNYLAKYNAAQIRRPYKNQNFLGEIDKLLQS